MTPKTGLDMYLMTERLVRRVAPKDALPRTGIIRELGRWRDYLNLHEFIVGHFGDETKDECQRIDLNLPDLMEILETVEQDKLPLIERPEKSSPKHKQRTIKIFKKAIEWLSTEPNAVRKSVYYQASRVDDAA